MVPRSVNCTCKRDNAGHEKPKVNKIVIISGVCLMVVYILNVKNLAPLSISIFFWSKTDGFKF